jgi:hypothetical protein
MIMLEDDLDGGPAGQTVRFGLGASEYETDLSAAKAGRFRAQLAPARRAWTQARRGQHARPRRTATARRDSAEVRARAKDHGIEISERGRIPASITGQCEAAATGP